MSKPVAAITGASSGIGAVFARKLAARGYDLILIARRQDRLSELAAALPGNHTVFAADLSSVQEVDRVAAHLRSEPRLDLLVNNAGFGTKGLFQRVDLESQVRMHRVHIDATLALTHAVLPGLVARDRGGVINVSSVAAFIRGAGGVSYCATKAWINAFTEGVHLDLAAVGSKVKVQALCPGYTYSEFHDVIQVDRTEIPSWLWLQAEEVVENSLRGFEAGKLIVVPGWFYRVFVALISRVPTAIRLRFGSGGSARRRSRL